MSVALPFLILFLSTHTRADVQDLKLYQACVMECFNCVKTYGKNTYNGRLCAENCALSRGESIDSKCYPPQKRGGSQHGLVQNCAKTCLSECAPSSRSREADSYPCIFTCIMSNYRIITC